MSTRCCGTCLYRSHIRVMHSQPEHNWCECTAEKASSSGLPQAYVNPYGGSRLNPHPMGVHSGTSCPVWKDSLFVGEAGDATGI